MNHLLHISDYPPSCTGTRRSSPAAFKRPCPSALEVVQFIAKNYLYSFTSNKTFSQVPAEIIRDVVEQRDKLSLNEFRELTNEFGFAANGSVGNIYISPVEVLEETDFRKIEFEGLGQLNGIHIERIIINWTEAT
ncbi:hypothetical protein L596_029362 [Steinernema carpocapsae]|uniref:Uncharacterized protein n=1 Tax=Steinernema carpocapsae TaxID=34508 RepID=A0A4U5LUE6_STECR|nr:hypothetical protein L596_029362 [Steinernema carpocapsae]